MSAQDPLRLLFVCSALPQDQSGSGGAIYDRRIIEALRSTGMDVEVYSIPRNRVFAPPFWRTKVNLRHKQEVFTRAQGRAVIISHEALFEAGELLNGQSFPTLLIVHNYMPRFEFSGHPIITRLYTAGAQSFFERSLGYAGRVMFLSSGDMAAAEQNHGSLISNKSCVFAPPARPAEVGERSEKTIHVDGTSGWLPKAMCQLTDLDMRVIEKRGYRTLGLGDSLQSANGIITDRFSVGYKLKLMQMIYAGDVIASFVDLKQEVEQVAPGYPCYRTVASLSDALDYFDSMKGQVSEDGILRAIASVRNYSWIDLAEEFSANLAAQIAGYQLQC